MNETSLGEFLKDRRTRLDPAAFGFGGRRRTKGLRREEVADRAGISPTWYTWLEQGRGGAPSSQALERIAKALMLTGAEREHAFLLGLGRLPEAHYAPEDSVSPRLQRVLDAMETSAAFIRSVTWDILAWNRASTVLMNDYGAIPAAERNLLRQMFLNPAARAAQLDWADVAGHMVAVFRADVARVGASGAVQEFVDDLLAQSPDFAAFWHDRQVGASDEGTKTIRHPVHGLIEFEFSSFAVAGRPDLAMMVYTPVDREAARPILKAAAHTPTS